MTANVFSKIRGYVFITVLATSLSGCASTIDTFVDYDKRVDFSKYQSFSWISDRPMIAAPNVAAISSPLMETRIQRAIASRLKARGYRLVPVGNDADFVVAFSLAGRKEVNVESYPVAYRGRWRWGGTYIGESVSVESTTEGMLSIDIFDGATKSPAWHGRATKRLMSADDVLDSPVIDNAVTEILKDFPPQT